MLEGLTCVYRSNVDLFFYVIGSAQENEVGGYHLKPLEFGLKVIPVWINDHMPSQVLNETHPVPNYKVCHQSWEMNK